MKRETKEKISKDIKTFLGDWKILDNGKMRRVVDPLRLKWFCNEIKLVENRGYLKCLQKEIKTLKKQL